MKKLIIVWMLILFVIPCIAAAEMEADFRIKLGSAAPLDTAEVPGIISSTPFDSDGGGNFQIEIIGISKQESAVGFMFGAGLFSRVHRGNDRHPTLPTQIDYHAAGFSLTAGVAIKSTENFHFEGKLELGLGVGEPDITTPGLIWNDVNVGPYGSASILFGGYYTFAKPGFQLGLELGLQSYAGDFEIYNSSTGRYVEGKTEGSGGVVNLALGYRF